jgi:hypothetical protein
MLAGCRCAVVTCELWGLLIVLPSRLQGTSLVEDGLKEWDPVQDPNVQVSTSMFYIFLVTNVLPSALPPSFICGPVPLRPSSFLLFVENRR